MAKHKENIIEKAYSYAGPVGDFRKLLQELGVDEKKILKDIDKLLQEDETFVAAGIIEVLAEKTGKPADT
ncbi:MAG: hypothetical protein ACK4OF_08290, partial [Aquificaceae bacterium]